MTFYSERRLVLLIALVAAALSACASRTALPGPELAEGTYEQAGFTYLRWREGPAIMIWHDFASGQRSLGVVADHELWEADGSATALDGRGFHWAARTAEGIAAQVRIGHLSYDIDKDTVFFVKTQGGQVTVRQLRRALGSVAAQPESCVSFAQSDPDIARFVREIR